MSHEPRQEHPHNNVTTNKQIRTMTKKKKMQLDYLINCLCDCSINIDREDQPTTEKEAITNVYNDALRIFKGYGNGYYKYFREFVCDWVQGLPINTIPFEYAEIVEIGKAWGYCKNQRQERNFVNNWFRCTANNLCDLWELNELNTYIFWKELLNK